MDLEIMEDVTTKYKDDCKQKINNDIMTSSVLSMTSSLSSPVDSGVQLLDSESEMTSVMSTSAIGYDNEASDTDNDGKVALNLKIGSDTCSKTTAPTLDENSHVMTKSDIANQNVTPVDVTNVSTSAPTCDFLTTNLESIGKLNCDLEPNVIDKLSNDLNFQHLTQNLSGPEYSPIKNKDGEVDLMNISLNSYELLDYTLQNVEQSLMVESDMHVSLSEEVNESLKVSLNDVKEAQNKPITEEADSKLIEEIKNVQELQPSADEQIVFRRQRKKKSKSDTPKKRVSFHEDILNSTKIDDIHINHGFVTIEPDVSASFFQRGFVRKPDVVKGRYSWAAEGDAPYYEATHGNHREVKSDIYIHTARFSSTSSSSSASISSSVDEEDTPPDEAFVKKEPTLTKPKSSCLKKKPKKKCIKTDIVEEQNSYKRRSDDTNIFGSLKNILFSTSVPLAERGVPEGQEDFSIYSSSHDLNFQRNRRSSNPNLRVKAFDVLNEAPVKKIDPIEQAKGNLKLTRSEGFYPNYPIQTVPSNILLCDSNVYEHKGISYSYEYDNFQKTFEQQKPKSSTLYQKILKEFNFFKRKAKETETEPTELEIVDEKKDTEKSFNKYTSTTKIDWSDNDTTISDFTESTNSRHLNSPKRKINKPNHYSIQQNFNKCDTNDYNIKSETNLRVSNSKTSLINRFLRNVTMKKILDAKLQRKQKASKRYLSLYVKSANINLDVNKDIDKLIEEEVIKGREAKVKAERNYDPNLLKKFNSEVFHCKEEFLQVLIE